VRALTDSPVDFELLVEQSFPKCAIPCLGRRRTAVQNITSLALSSAEKSVTVQTHIHTKQGTKLLNSKRSRSKVEVGGEVCALLNALLICLPEMVNKDEYNIKRLTAKRRSTRTTPYDSPGILVFLCQKYQRNSNGVTPTGALNRVG